ncbi:hypothetical protein S83_063017, partial [Arachis hypogaea]
DSSADDDFSTGYLQDALLEFGDRSKRRRLLPNADNHHDQQYSKTSSNDLEKSLWNLNPHILHEPEYRKHFWTF